MALQVAAWHFDFDQVSTLRHHVQKQHEKEIFTWKYTIIAWPMCGAWLYLHLYIQWDRKRRIKHCQQFNGYTNIAWQLNRGWCVNWRNSSKWGSIVQLRNTHKKYVDIQNEKFSHPRGKMSNLVRICKGVVIRGHIHFCFSISWWHSPLIYRFKWHYYHDNFNENVWFSSRNALNSKWKPFKKRKCSFSS